MSSKCNKNFGRGLPPEALARTVVDEIDNGIELCLRDRAEIEGFGEAETQNIVGVFVRAALPRFMRLGKIHGGLQILLQKTKFGKFGTVIERNAFDNATAQQFFDRIPRFRRASAVNFAGFLEPRFPIRKRHDQAFSDAAVNGIALPIAEPCAIFDLLGPFWNGTIRE